MIDLGEESHFRRRHRVLLREEQLELEHAACAQPSAMPARDEDAPSNGDESGPDTSTSK